MAGMMKGITWVMNRYTKPRPANLWANRCGVLRRILRYPQNAGRWVTGNFGPMPSD
jgi:hypothetical protein